MENLKKKLWEELEEIDRKPEIGPGDLELAHKLSDTIKNIDKICMLEEDGGYSSAVDGGDYGRGSSYANRGQHYVRGHYSRDGGMDRGGYSSRRDSRGRYSRDDGRSEMMEHLEMAMDSATEQDRENIKRFMRQLENA
jgi:hypothetical protein